MCREIVRLLMELIGYFWVSRNIRRYTRNVWLVGPCGMGGLRSLWINVWRRRKRVRRVIDLLLIYHDFIYISSYHIIFIFVYT
jgi:hypothetical protein